MATQTIDGKWTETKPLSGALLELQDMLIDGMAKRFVVGTNQEIEEEKSRISLEKVYFDFQ